MPRCSRSRFPTWAWAWILFAMASPWASAAEITITFTGQVTSVGPPTRPPLPLGGPVTGTVVLDTRAMLSPAGATADERHFELLQGCLSGFVDGVCSSAPLPDVRNAFKSISVTTPFGGFEFDPQPLFGLEERIDQRTGAVNGVSLSAHAFIDWYESPLGTLSGEHYEFWLDFSAIPGFSDPDEAWSFDLSSFGSASGGFSARSYSCFGDCEYFEDRQLGFSISAATVSIVPDAEVPEPSMLALVLLGVALASRQYRFFL